MWETARVDTLEENESQEVKPVALGHLGRGGTRTLHVYTPLSDQRRPRLCCPVVTLRAPGCEGGTPAPGDGSLPPAPAIARDKVWGLLAAR